MGRGILIQESFYEAMQFLPDRERLELFDGICAYSLNGTVPENLSPVAKSMFILMKPNIDSSTKKYTAAVSNGKKHSKKNKEEAQTEEPSSNQSDNQSSNQSEDQNADHDYDYDLDLDLDYDLDSNSDLDSDSDASAKGSPPKRGKALKHKYGEYKNVLLTDEEVYKLKQELPNYDELVQRLSEYIASSGKKYKSHYATLRTWNRREPKSKKPPQLLPEDDLSDILMGGMK